MLEYRERNENRHIVSEDELVAFAWAGYYANCSSIFINGTNYEVVHTHDSVIELSNGKYLPVGCYAIFKSDKELIICDDHKLKAIRKENPLKQEYYCFNDEQFLKVVK